MLKNILMEAKEQGELTPDKRNIILVTGEKFMAEVFSTYLTANQLNTQTITPEELKIRSDGHFFNAMIDLTQDFSYVKEKLRESGIIVFDPISVEEMDIIGAAETAAREGKEEVVFEVEGKEFKLL